MLVCSVSQAKVPVMTKEVIRDFLGARSLETYSKG